jgi:hypothetical protein
VYILPLLFIFLQLIFPPPPAGKIDFDPFGIVHPQEVRQLKRKLPILNDIVLKSAAWFRDIIMRLENMHIGLWSKYSKFRFESKVSPPLCSRPFATSDSKKATKRWPKQERHTSQMEQIPKIPCYRETTSTPQAATDR